MSRRDPRRTAVIAAAVLAFALVCGFTVAHFAGRRPAGGTAMGSSTPDVRSELAVCLSGGGVGTIDQTVACYDDVLKTDPTNAEAKTYRAGIQLMANGDVTQINALIDVAQSNPEYPDVHAFLAVAFDRIGRPDSALAELHKLDTLNPSPLLLDLTSALRSRLEAGTTTTTVVTPTTG